MRRLGDGALGGCASETEWRLLLPENFKSKTATPPATSGVKPRSNTRRIVKTRHQPAGARIFINAGPDAVRETPCSIQVLKGDYRVRVSLPGYTDAEDAVAIGTCAGADHGERPARSAPGELAPAPVHYRIGADFGASRPERVVTVKPGARLRLTFKP